MKSNIVTNLVDSPATVRILGNDISTFRPGRPFEIPVVVTNSSKAPLSWTQQNTLNLSYRWIGSDGNVVDRDGLRTSLPDNLLPGQSCEIMVGGMSPSEAGEYSLLISFVLEGRHWACDVSSSGSATHQLFVMPVAAWPLELKESRGAKALRGAIVANELWRLLEKQRVGRAKTSTVGPVARGAEMARADIHPRPTLVGRMSGWFRSANNISAIDAKLDDILDHAHRQNEKLKSLELQVTALRDQLDANQNGKNAVPEFMENFSEAREKVRIHLLARFGSSFGRRGASSRAMPQPAVKKVERGAKPQSPAR